MERMNIAIGTAGILSAVVVGANILGNLVAGILIGRGAKRSTLIAVSSAVMGAMGLGIFMSAMPVRSEEHTSELQSLMRISYAVFCLKKKKKQSKQSKQPTKYK